MHIITGLLLSGLFSGKKGQNVFRGFRGLVEIRHQTPGRIRFFIPLLKQNAEKGHVLEQQLTKADAIHKVQTTQLTGSLLIEFDHSKLSPETLTGVLIKLLGFEAEAEKPMPSVAAKELKRILDAANRTVSDKTEGVLDLNSFVTLAFLSLGVWSLVRNPNIMPSGVSLLYWAYNNAIKM